MRIDNQLFHEILDDIELYIPKLKEANSTVSDILYSTFTNEIQVIFGQYLQGLVQLTQSLLATLEDANEHIPILANNLLPSLDQLTQCLTVIERALLSEQYVVIADLMKTKIESLLVEVEQAIKESRKA